jgi:hypothetical protein
MKKKIKFLFDLIRSSRMVLSFNVKKIKILLTNNPYILSRTACLGNDIQASVFKAGIIKFNFQKSRVDHLVANTESKIPLLNALEQILRKDLWPLIYFQSQSFFAFNKKPECIVLDSYSELTDQKFTTFEKNNFFFANYSDVNLKLTNNKFHSEGLIDLDGLNVFYRKLFERLTKQYGKETPIFFIHFQTELDPREKFKARSEYILKVIEQVVTEGKFNLYSISINNSDVSQADNDDFYYHYSMPTYDVYINKFLNTLKAVDVDKYNSLTNITNVEE